MENSFTEAPILSRRHHRLIRCRSLSATLPLNFDNYDRCQAQQINIAWQAVLEGLEANPDDVAIIEIVSVVYRTSQLLSSCMRENPHLLDLDWAEGRLGIT